MVYVIKHGFADENLDKLLNFLSENSVIAVDTETNGLNPRECVLLSMQLFADGVAFVIISRDIDFYRFIVEKLEQKTLIFHNAKFDVAVLYAKTGILLKNIRCTMIAERLITSGLSSNYYTSLKDLVIKYTGNVLDKSERESFYAQDLSETFTDAQIAYSVNDVLYLFDIFTKQFAELERLNLTQVFDLEMQLTPVLVVSEHIGVLLDKQIWLELSSEADKKRQEKADAVLTKVVDDIFSVMQFRNALDACRTLSIAEPLKRKRDVAYLMGIVDESMIKDLLKRYLNLNSPIQVKQILNDVYGLNVKDTNEKTLNKIDHQIIRDILEYREYSKSYSSFGESFLRHVESDGRIHTNYNQLGAVTGRMSSENPNLQNIKREEAYRRPFIASPGYKFICADYSQEELRIMADVSRETSMIEAFNSGADLHALTASKLFKKPLNEITKDERSVGKSMNFAVIYGVSEHGLFRNYGIDPEVGKKYLDDFLNKIYPNIGLFFNRVGRIILEKLYSSTLFGRKRFFEHPKDEREVSSIIRKGINMIIQGTGADIIKIAMVRMFYDNPWGIDRFRVLLQVHDEIVVEVDEKISEEAKAFVEQKMLDAEGLFLKYVKPEVDAKISDYWVH